MPDETTPPAQGEPAPRSMRATPAASAPAAETKTHEQWRAQKGTPLERYAPTVAFHGWPEGFVVSEADYDAAVDTTMGARLGSNPVTLKHPS